MNFSKYNPWLGKWSKPSPQWESTIHSPGELVLDGIGSELQKRENKIIRENELFMVTKINTKAGENKEPFALLLRKQ